jgi:enamine deaminase RidA (YjgF/YER057c/UK114 family)
MPGSPEQRLADAGLALPRVVAPVGVYVPVVGSGDLLFSSGQVALADGQLVAVGKLGEQVTTEQGYACARQCALNILAAISAHLGGLETVQRVVMLTVFVAASAGFTELPQVADSASELFETVFGDGGRPARSAVGVTSLPLDAAGEIGTVVQLHHRDLCPS